jgi:hypothetical protein
VVCILLAEVAYLVCCRWTGGRRAWSRPSAFC